MTKKFFCMCNGKCWQRFNEHRQNGYWDEEKEAEHKRNRGKTVHLYLFNSHLCVCEWVRLNYGALHLVKMNGTLFGCMRHIIAIIIQFAMMPSFVCVFLCLLRCSAFTLCFTSQHFIFHIISSFLGECLFYYFQNIGQKNIHTHTVFFSLLHATGIN